MDGKTEENFYAGTDANAQVIATASTKVNNNGKSILNEIHRTQVSTSFTCATWSQNPKIRDWEVTLVLHTDDADDLNTLIGFMVKSNNDEKHGLGESSSLTNHYSHHDIMDMPTFVRLLNKGNQFTKLELVGEFFNNAYLCPELGTSTSNANVDLISVPNLKTLVIKPELTLVLKGKDKETQHKYFHIHQDHSNTLKPRAARNLAFLFEVLDCPNLTALEIADCMEWDDLELKNCGHYYWSSPLIGFLQRHAHTLKNLKITPLICVPKDTSDKFDSTSGVPVVDDLLFWIKFHLNDLSDIEEGRREAVLQRELMNMMRPWDQFLLAQSNLKTVVWITDIHCPWNFTRTEFIRLCQDNSSVESLMIAMHGDKRFREIHELQEQPCSVKDFEVDAAVIHGITALKILSIGCYQSDPQKDLFSIKNLHLLPRSLETVQIFGVTVMANELKNLTELPKLKNLTIVQGKRLVYTEQDQVNGNVEGVTAEVLQKLIYARSLDKLVIVGFPMEGKNCQPELKTGKLGWLGNFGAFCFPALAESGENATGKDEETDLKVNLKLYSTQLQDILRTAATIGVLSEVSQEVQEGEGEEYTAIRLVIAGNMAKSKKHCSF